jgi:hypothetical protein
MYGIVNQAIQGLVTRDFGDEKWEEIKQLSGIKESYFISDQSYEDNITFELVSAATEVLNLSADDILQAFGKYWVLNTAQKKYGDLLKTGGSSFPDFIRNLPNFHSRIMLIYPKLSPPEFQVNTIDETTLELHYYSTRSGLTHFVIGLIYGLGEFFETPVVITPVTSSSNPVWHDSFIIKHG